MMTFFKPQPGVKPRVLATDLDGTLIPLPGSVPNAEDLDTLCGYRNRHRFTLLFATGRHFESVVGAIAEHRLPTPDWIVCDVGSAIYRYEKTGFVMFDAYHAHLSEQTGKTRREDIERKLGGIAGLALQPPDHQQRFKISYESASDELAGLVQEVNARLQEAALPFACAGSIDPFLHCGLLDVLPRGVSKAYALNWLATHADFTPDEVIYAGDSGNDLAALISGFRAIIVANRSHGLTEEVTATHQERELRDRLYLAAGEATSGVLEGCRHFGLFDR